MAADQTDKMKAPLHLRFFLGSPADAASARGIAQEVLRELPLTAAFRGQVTIETFAYDDPLALLPISATVNPEESIARFGTLPRDSDVTLLFFWWRLGTPVMDLNKAPGESRNLTGTEWEYYDAAGRNRDVFIYHRDEPPPFEQPGRESHAADPNLAAHRAQYAALREFLATVRQKDGASQGSITTYRDGDVLRQVLVKQMTIVLRNYLERYRRQVEEENRRRLKVRMFGASGGAVGLTALGVALWLTHSCVQLEPIPYCDILPGMLQLELTYSTTRAREGDQAWAQLATDRNFEHLVRSDQLSELSPNRLPVYIPNWTGSPSSWQGWLRIALRDPAGGDRTTSGPVQVDCQRRK